MSWTFNESWERLETRTSELSRVPVVDKSNNISMSNGP